ncbi:hypothetical protein H6S82_00685 [Planktothrix sp. FACHB-1355]|uniref:Uncharacterized protein n=1 Tax=Aerosakkonema funiforme FACHB-1375 TaxID=2949571 RepID=A0A926VCF5_9CYAN|nr:MULTISPECIES: hypothetical protein [Oscillatoriales]MBD2181005.1 hypothetical protein [Aerosakkonema funiforme FACHB-1375]MBD3557385.1 hypothetical protein [Planktothrix sp. FACHB-1355]
MQIINTKKIPSDKLVRLVRIFHFSLAFFLLLGTLFLNGCTNNSIAAVPLQWKQADSIPPILLQLAVNENTSATPNRLNDVLVASIPTKDKKQLYIFNYNSPDTCGKLGCLYVGYLEKGESSYQRVLNLYLQPNLPPKHSLISINSDVSSSSLPCLEIKQVDKSNLQIVTYCFNGSFYQPTKSIQTLVK